MIKVLLIHGSMRGKLSSSRKVAMRFLDGIKDTVETEVTEVFLRDKDIKPCNGCFYCWKKGQGSCAIRDDMDELRTLVMDSDVIIESYPLYFFGMPSSMKAFTDRMITHVSEYRAKNGDESGRFLHEMRYPELMTKKFVMISTCGYERTDDCYDSIRLQFNQICGEEGYTFITVPQGGMLAEKSFENKTDRYLEKFADAGREYASNWRLSEETIKKLNRPMLGHRTFEMAINMNWDNEDVGPYGKVTIES